MYFLLLVQKCKRGSKWNHEYFSVDRSRCNLIWFLTLSPFIEVWNVSITQNNMVWCSSNHKFLMLVWLFTCSLATTLTPISLIYCSGKILNFQYWISSCQCNTINEMKNLTYDTSRWTVTPNLQFKKNIKCIFS